MDSEEREIQELGKTLAGEIINSVGKWSILTDNVLVVWVNYLCDSKEFFNSFFYENNYRPMEEDKNSD